MSSSAQSIKSGPVANKQAHIGFETTQDEFFRGGFHAIQKARGAHRSGLDALFVAACLTDIGTARVADLGAGSGVAGMSVAVRNKNATVDLVENSKEMVALAQAGLNLKANGFAKRLKTIQADVCDNGAAREKAGLLSNTYDHIITNPPYNDPSYRPSPDTLREAAHMMGQAGLDPWLRTAASVLKADGTLSIIVRPTSMGQLIAGFQGRFGAVRFLPIHPKPGEPANRLVATAVKGSRAPLQLLPGFVVHNSDGTATDEADDILNGRAGLPIKT